MPIDRLSSTAALIATLRSDVLRKLDQNPGAAGTRAVRADRNPGSGAPDVQQLRGQLAEIARDVDLSDAQAVGHARTRFVRTVVLWEFGQEFREHPEWRPLMDRIEQALTGDDAQSQRFLDLLAALKPRKRR